MYYCVTVDELVTIFKLVFTGHWFWHESSSPGGMMLHQFLQILLKFVSKSLRLLFEKIYKEECLINFMPS
jgi:hypothetical protein